MRRPFLSLLLCLPAGVLPLAAQQTEFGIQGLAAISEQALRSQIGSRPGFEIGVHEGIYLQNGQELRPRIDYTRFDNGSFSFSSLNSTTTVWGISAGADYLCYLEGGRRGLYGVAGLNLSWWTAYQRFAGSQRETSPSLLFGFGHRFNSNLAVEFEDEYGHFQPEAGSMNTFKGGVFYQF